ncbi:MAG: hypothetical protein JWO86_122 [Myxococcaceae bacterium]|nr:hypothetical protein [Myxococcaceae bacterium]
MHHAAIASAFEGTVLLSTAAALGIGAHLSGARSGARTASAAIASVPNARARRSLATLALHPLAQLLFVCALLYVNQVLFGAFILRAHGGSTSFIAQYIPGEWFAIGRHDPLVHLAARHVGDGRWLSPTLLRVQAFLELPFTMFAYLAIARLLGRRVYATLCTPVVLALAALSFSFTFSLVELELANPYTSDDLVLRGAACLVVPMYIAWIAKREARRSPVLAAPAGPSGVLGLLAFLAGAGALSYIVLALYDAFLLYNLAHFSRYASGIALSLLIAVLAAYGAPRVDRALARATGARMPSPAVDVCVSALRTFTILFFVPSLSLRYWGAHPTAVACGVLVVLVAFLGGAIPALQRSRGMVVRLAMAGAVALGLGGWAAHVVLVAAGHGMPELLLARLALSFLVVAITSFRAGEIALCWASDETKAEADEA